MARCKYDRPTFIRAMADGIRKYKTSGLQDEQGNKVKPNEEMKRKFVFKLLNHIGSILDVDEKGESDITKIWPKLKQKFGLDKMSGLEVKDILSSLKPTSDITEESVYKSADYSTDNLTRYADKKAYRDSFKKAYLQKYFGFCNDAIDYCKQTSNTAVIRGFLVADNGFERTVIHDDVQLNKSVADVLNELYSHLLNYASNSGIDVSNLPLSMYTTDGEYTGAFEKLDAMLGDALVRTFTPSALQQYFDRMKAEDTTVDDKGLTVSDKINAYNAYVMLKNFDQVVKGILGKSVYVNEMLPKFASYNGFAKKYSIEEAKASQMNTTWRTTDEIHIEKEVSKIVQLLVSQCTYADTGRNVTFSEFGYIIAKLKDLPFKLGKLEAKFDKDKSRFMSLSQDAQELFDGKTLPLIIPMFRENGQRVFPALFEILSNDSVRDFLTDSNTSYFEAQDISLIKAIYKGLFDRTDSRSLISALGNDFLNRNYLSYITEVADSISDSKYLQYYRDRNTGNVYIRNMYDLTVNNIIRSIEQSVTTQNTERVSANYERTQKLFDLKLDDTLNTQNATYTISTSNGNIHVRTYTHTLATLYTDDNGRKMTLLKSMYTDIRKAFDEIYHLNISTDEVLWKTLEGITGSESAAIDSIMSLLNMAVTNIAVLHHALLDKDGNLQQSAVAIDNALNTYYGNETKPKTNVRLGGIELTCDAKYPDMYNLARAIATAQGRLTSSVVRDGEGNSIPNTTLSRLLGNIKTQFELESGVPGAPASHFDIFRDGVLRGIYQAKELNDAYTGTNTSHLEFTPCEVETSEIMYDFIKGLKHRDKGASSKSPVGEGVVAFLPSANSDKSYIGRIIVDLHSMVTHQNGDKSLYDWLFDANGNLNQQCKNMGIPYIHNVCGQYIKENIGEYYKKSQESIIKTWGRFRGAVQEYSKAHPGSDTYVDQIQNIEKPDILLDYINHIYSLNSLKETPLQFVNRIVRWYNNQHPNDTIAITENVHYEQDKKTKFLMSNKMLDNMLDIMTDNNKIAEYFDIQEAKIIGDLIQDGFSMPVGADSMPIAYYNSTPIYDATDLRAYYPYDDVRTAVRKMHAVKNPDGSQALHINPILAIYNMLNYAVTQQWMCATVGSHYAHPSKKIDNVYFLGSKRSYIYDSLIHNKNKGILTEQQFTLEVRKLFDSLPPDEQKREDIGHLTLIYRIWKRTKSSETFENFVKLYKKPSTVGLPGETTYTEDEIKSFLNTRRRLLLRDEADRYNAQVKRNVAFTAAMHAYQLNQLNGIPEHANITVIKDNLASIGTLMGVDEQVPTSDGATYVNPMMSYWENGSLGSEKVGTNKKQFIHGYDPNTGTGVIIKTAGFSMTNEIMRGSIFQRRMTQMMLDHEYRDELGRILKDKDFNLLEDYNGNKISLYNTGDREGNLYIRKYIDGKYQYYRITKITRDETTGKYTRYIEPCNNDGIKTGTEGKDTQFTDVSVNTNYKLWLMLGGYECYEMKRGMDLMSGSEASIRIAADIANRVGIRKGKSQNIESQNDLYQFMKLSDIHYMATEGAVKFGAANAEDINAYLKGEKPIEDFRPNFFRLRLLQAGIQLDKEHNADQEELSLFTQVISACAARGFTRDQAQRLYESLAALADEAVSPYVDGFMEYFSSNEGGKEQFQTVISDLIARSLMSQDNSSSALNYVVANLIQLAQEGKKIQFKDNIPFSDPAIYSKLISTIGVALTRSAVKIKIAGVLAVLCPSYDVVKLYNGKFLSEYAPGELEAIQEKKDSEDGCIYINGGFRDNQDIDLCTSYKVFLKGGGDEARKLGIREQDVHSYGYDILIETPVQRKQFKEMLASKEGADNVIKVSENVMVGRNLAPYDVKFDAYDNDGHKQHFSLYDIDTVSDMFLPQREGALNIRANDFKKSTLTFPEDESVFGELAGEELTAKSIDDFYKATHGNSQADIFEQNAPYTEDASEDGTEPKLYHGKMFKKYFNDKAPGIVSTSLIQAIRNGENIATTKFESDSSIGYWKQLKAGDYIDFDNGDGQHVIVRVTQPLHKLDESTSYHGSGLNLGWGDKEGWSEDYFERKVKPKIEQGQAYQMEYKYVMSPAVKVLTSRNLKDQLKINCADKFIGYSNKILNSSTAQYALLAGFKANTGSYNKGDVVFTSILGRRGDIQYRRWDQNRTIDESLNALHRGAFVLTDNIDYLKYSMRNAYGYIDEGDSSIFANTPVGHYQRQAPSEAVPDPAKINVNMTIPGLNDDGHTVTLDEAFNYIAHHLNPQDSLESIFYVPSYIYNGNKRRLGQYIADTILSTLIRHTDYYDNTEATNPVNYTVDYSRKGLIGKSYYARALANAMNFKKNSSPYNEGELLMQDEFVRAGMKYETVVVQDAYTDDDGTAHDLNLTVWYDPDTVTDITNLLKEINVIKDRALNRTRPSDSQLQSVLNQLNTRSEKSQRTVTINGKVWTVDPESIESIPYEVVLPKVFATNFGLNVNDRLSDIEKDPDFFTKKVLKNVGKTIDSKYYSLAFPNLQGDPVYVLDRNHVDASDNFRPVDVMTSVDEYGNVNILDSEYNKIHTLSKTARDVELGKVQDEVYEYIDPATGLSHKVIVTDDLLYWVDNSHSKSLSISDVNVTPEEACAFLDKTTNKSLNLWFTNLATYTDDSIIEKALEKRSTAKKQLKRPLKNNTKKSSKEDNEEYSKLLNEYYDKKNGIDTEYYKAIGEQFNNNYKNVWLKQIDIAAKKGMAACDEDFKQKFLARIKTQGDEVYNSFVKSLETVAARIPAQSMQSFMSMRVAGFVPSDVNTAYVSTLQTYLQGSDYDVDAVSLAMFDFDRSGRLIAWSKDFNLSSKDFFKASLTLPMPTGKMVQETDNAVSIDSLPFITQEQDGSLKVNLDTPFLLREYGKFIEDVSRNGLIVLDKTGRPDQRATGNLKAIVNNYNMYLKSIKDTKRREGAIKNFMIELINDIIKNPVNQEEALSSVDGTVAPFKKMADESPMAKDQTMNTPGAFTTNIYAINTNLVGKKGVGISAVGLKTFFELSLYVNTKIENAKSPQELSSIMFDVPFDGKHYKTIANVFASESKLLQDPEVFQNEVLQIALQDQDLDAALGLSSILSLSVDNAKELALKKLNCNNDTQGMWLYGLSIGIPAYNIFKTMTSPIGIAISNALHGNKFTGFDNFSMKFLLKSLEYYTTPGQVPLLKEWWISRPSNQEITQHDVDSLHEFIYSQKNVRNESLYNDLSSFFSVNFMQEKAFDYITDSLKTKGFLHDLLSQYFISDTGKNILVNSCNLLNSPLVTDKEEFMPLIITELTRSGDIDAVLSGIRRDVVSNKHEEDKNKADLCDIIQGISVWAHVYKQRMKDSMGYFSNFKVLQRGADELRAFGQILHLNLGLYTTQEETLSFLQKFQGLAAQLYDLPKNSPLNKIDLHAFVTSDEYRNTMITEYEKLRQMGGGTFNLLEAIATVPNYFKYLQLIDMQDSMYSAISAKYRTVKSLGSDVLFDTGAKSKKDVLNILKRCSQYVDNYVINKWMMEKDGTGIELRVPAGTPYLQARGMADTEYTNTDAGTVLDDTVLQKTLSVDTYNGYTINLGTADGRATFKYWMENTVIPSLKNGYTQEGDQSFNQNVKDNHFIKHLVLSINTNTPMKTAVTAYTPGINMSPRTDQQETELSRMKNAFRQLTGVKYYTADTNYDLTDLFFLYNLVVYLNRVGETTLSRLFENMRDNNLIKSYYEYINYTDRNVETLCKYDSTDNNMLALLLPIASKNSTMLKKFLGFVNATGDVSVIRRRTKQDDAAFENSEMGMEDLPLEALDAMSSPFIENRIPASLYFMNYDNPQSTVNVSLETRSEDNKDFIDALGKKCKIQDITVKINSGTVLGIRANIDGKDTEIKIEDGYKKYFKRIPFKVSIDVNGRKTEPDQELYIDRLITYLSKQC